jgi:hypothetical protein
MVNPKLVLEAIEEYFEKVTTEQYFEDEARIENEPDVIWIETAAEKWLGHAEKTLDDDTRITQRRDLAALGKVRIQLSQLAEIPEALARELAKVLDLTVADGRRVAAQAPVAALGARARFQIPLGTYFRDVLHLSDGIVQQWAEATLSFQQRGEHVRFVLNSCAQGWALAISLGGHSAKVLDNNNRDGGLIDCPTADIDCYQMAIIPFRPRP